ncbi:MAG TPA: hypothetical protein VJ732_01710 [Bryobacteraceae bacterium]|nr:hypothetical protein [Bryobacteraceae bacterium]
MGGNIEGMVAAVDRAIAAQSTLKAAASAESVDWRMLAAIGIYETGFVNKKENDGAGVGVGIFQITNGGDLAANLPWAADVSAGMLRDNFNQITKALPTLSQQLLTQALADSWNLGPGSVINNIEAGLSPDYHSSPITRNGVVVGYRGGGDGQYGSDVVKPISCF